MDDLTEAIQKASLEVSDIDALEKAKLITGITRKIAEQLYTDNPKKVHEQLDALMLGLLETNYPRLVRYIKSIRLWYG